MGKNVVTPCRARILLGHHALPEAVDVRVDEAGQTVGVLQLHHLKSGLVKRERRFAADGDDGVLLAQYPAAFDPFIGGQAVVQQEQNATFFLHIICSMKKSDIIICTRNNFFQHEINRIRQKSEKSFVFDLLNRKNGAN